VFAAKRVPPGAPPGTLIADPDAVPSVIRVIAYDGKQIVEQEAADLAQLDGLLGRFAVTWVNVDGLADVETIRRLGERFDIHRLALEDVVNVHQRPKIEEYEDHTYLVTRVPTAGEVLETEQISIFVGKGYVLTFQERIGDPFEPVRQRLRNDQGRIRTSGEDYLMYALLDAAIDSFYPVLERHGERVERLEQDILAHPGSELIGDIHVLKRDLLTLRRAIWPQREMINALIRDSAARITPATGIHLRDCYDHTVQLLDMVETYREIASGMVDMHFSSISTRMNEIMKVLTIIATIFIPLGFIAGLYGMNFDRAKSPLNMPELGWYWGYPFALGVMAAVAVLMLCYFWRRGWIADRTMARPRGGGKDDGTA